MDDVSEVRINIVEVVLSDEGIQVDETVAQTLEFGFYLLGATLEFVDGALEVISNVLSRNYNGNDIVAKNIHYAFCQLFHFFSILKHFC